MSEPIFKIRNVSKSFGSKTVLSNINLDIYAGEVLGVIGSSGSGKTTLLNTIIGFLKPEKGDVLFRQAHLLKSGTGSGYDSVYRKKFLVKQTYGFASQLPSFYKKLSVKENLDYFGTLYDLSKTAIVQNRNTLLKLMDLNLAENTLAENLSGGMERRLDIACAMMHDPDVLILDEPTADLDPLLKNHIWQLLRSINKKGTTVLVSSHHLQDMEKLCTRVALLKYGKIVDIGPPDEIRIKYQKAEEIVIESYPGDYKKLLSKLKLKSIIKTGVNGTELSIFTTNPAKVLHRILHIVEEAKEEIIELRVIKPTLEDVFLSMSSKKENDVNYLSADKDDDQEIKIEVG
ncbi:MAG: ABC transporter ATP-binding protein [Nanoarchaeota archaeon]|nr:ABC transporter ATP-binding protein [Nanoarchaeota archaeon]